jgi:hypothetical protein
MTRRGGMGYSSGVLEIRPLPDHSPLGRATAFLHLSAPSPGTLRAPTSPTSWTRCTGLDE